MPLQAIQAAVERRTIGGEVLGSPDLELDVETALRAHTLAGAAVAGRQHEIGSLEPGKLADLVVLSEDPTAVEVERISTIEASET